MKFSNIKLKSSNLFNKISQNNTFSTKLNGINKKNNINFRFYSLEKVSMEDIKAVRKVTGAGISDCREALVKTKNKVQDAINLLGEKAINAEIKKSASSSKEGQIILKTENDEKGGLGVIFEIMCETDFAAKSNPFVEWSKMINESGFELHKSNELGLTESTLATNKLQDQDLLKDSIKKVTAKIGERITIRRLGSIKEENGVVCGFLHAPNKVAKAGAIVSLKSNTPYRQKLQRLGEELAVHITAFNPKYLRREDVPAGENVDDEDILFLQDFEGGKTFGDYLARTIKKDFRKENIEVASYYRFGTGEDLEENQIVLLKSENKESFGF
eukprot:TRINITY_DN7207_c0_g1_i1.p1 TRINITY_DN7207_c0_g1~~TRINITY_DN7207_c0_g1_i1.p1  ORF type:complete len:329 (-),score=113.48 TRINITY_DN7207_c0_g1_i1:107-1093(-)